MVDVAKREDRLLDFISKLQTRINFALLEIETFREAGGLTAREIDMLNTVHKALVLEESE